MLDWGPQTLSSGLLPRVSAPLFSVLSSGRLSLGLHPMDMECLLLAILAKILGMRMGQLELQTCPRTNPHAVRTWWIGGTSPAQLHELN